MEWSYRVGGFKTGRIEMITVFWSLKPFSSFGMQIREIGHQSIFYCEYIMLGVTEIPVFSIE